MEEGQGQGPSCQGLRMALQLEASCRSHSGGSQGWYQRDEKEIVIGKIAQGKLPSSWKLPKCGTKKKKDKILKFQSWVTSRAGGNPLT